MHSRACPSLLTARGLYECRLHACITSSRPRRLEVWLDRCARFYRRSAFVAPTGCVSLCGRYWSARTCRWSCTCEARWRWWFRWSLRWCAVCWPGRCTCWWCCARSSSRAGDWIWGGAPARRASPLSWCSGRSWCASFSPRFSSAHCAPHPPWRWTRDSGEFDFCTLVWSWRWCAPPPERGTSPLVDGWRRRGLPKFCKRRDWISRNASEMVPGYDLSIGNIFVTGVVILKVNIIIFTKVIRVNLVRVKIASKIGSM